MTSSLRDGLSFCLLGDRIVFLDLPQDRYFGLAPGVEEVFKRAIAGDPLTARERALLGAARVIKAGDTPLSLHACQAATPRRSIFEHRCGRSRSREIAAFAWQLLRARLNLRFRGLPRTMEGVVRRKQDAAAAAVNHTGAEQVLARAAEAQHKCARIFGSHDLCLPYAIALADLLFAQGVPAEIVIAVGMPPFRAHAWVQSGDILVNERLDIAADYTPIAVL
jgi:hypothetical protein